MKKNKKILIFVAIIMVIVCSNVAIYAITNKSVVDFFFDGKKANGVSNMLVHDGQSFKIDDYKITLEESLCESSTQFGYLVFSIDKDNGKPVADINDSGDCSFFGENNRFSFDILVSGGASSKYVYVGDVLYAYISFVEEEFNDENSEYKIAIIDHEQKSNDEEKHYNFVLKFSKKSKSFNFDKGDFAISPLGIRIYSKEKLNDIKIEALNKKMDSNVLVDTSKSIGVDGSGEHGRKQKGEGAEFVYTFEFKEIKDISDIEYIKLNGEKYKIAE